MRVGRALIPRPGGGRMAARRSFSTNEFRFEHDLSSGRDAAGMKDLFSSAKRAVRPPRVLEDRLKELFKEYPIPRAVSDFNKLVADEEAFLVGGGGKPLKYDARRTMAYIAFRMLPAYTTARVALARVLETGHVLRPAGRALTALDFGSGCGSASWAAFHASGCSYNDFEVTFVEPSKSMMEAASQLSADVFKTNWARNLLEMARVSTRKAAARYDVVLCTYALSEIQSAESRAVAVDLLWQFVAPGGVLLVLESGNQRGFEIVGTAREQILGGGSAFDLSQLLKPSPRGEKTPYHIPRVLAPCGHENKCPLLEMQSSIPGDAVPPPLDLDAGMKFTQARQQPFDANTSKLLRAKPLCYFSQSTDRLLVPTHRTQSPQTVSYSYVAIHKSPDEAAGHRGFHPSQRVRAPEAESPQVRVLRTPVHRARHLLMDLCGPHGIQRSVLSKSQGALYKQGKRVQWGGSVDSSALKHALAATGLSEEEEGEVVEEEEEEEDEEVGEGGQSDLFDPEAYKDEDGVEVEITNGVRKAMPSRALAERRRRR